MQTKHLLIVAHAPSPNTQKLRDAVVEGAGLAEAEGVEIIAKSASQGDREAFRRLLERHYDMINRVALRFTGSGADAEDIAQDVCLALVRKIQAFRSESLSVCGPRLYEKKPHSAKDWPDRTV